MNFKEGFRPHPDPLPSDGRGEVAAISTRLQIFRAKDAFDISKYVSKGSPSPIGWEREG
jgi:hypothetical protein